MKILPLPHPTQASQRPVESGVMAACGWPRVRAPEPRSTLSLPRSDAAGQATTLEPGHSLSTSQDMYLGSLRYKQLSCKRFYTYKDKMVNAGQTITSFQDSPAAFISRSYIYCSSPPYLFSLWLTKLSGTGGGVRGPFVCNGRGLLAHSVPVEPVLS